MRIWKAVTLLLILAIVGACANTPDGENKTEEAAAASADAGADKAKAEAPKAPPVKVPAGTVLNVVLSMSLDSGKNNAGDTFTANLAEPVIVDGKTVLDKGTAIEGKVVSAESAGKVKGVGKMSLTLTSATVGGKSVALATKTHSAEANSTKGKDAAIIGGGAGVGAAVGAIAGGKKGAAIGAAVGGGGGTAAVLATKGKDVEYPAESQLSFTLDQDLTIVP
jgi:hypothetical protein